MECCGRNIVPTNCQNAGLRYGGVLEPQQIKAQNTFTGYNTVWFN